MPPTFIQDVEGFNNAVWSIVLVAGVVVVVMGTLLGLQKHKEAQEAERLRQQQFIAKEHARLERERIKAHKAKIAQERAYLRDLKVKVVEKQ